MSERVARVVGESPRRRIGFGTVIGALLVAAALLLGGVFASSAPPARAASAAPRQHPRAHANPTPNQQQINAKVTALIDKMTVAEKFGQLEMAGPSTPTGSDLIPLAKAGKIGSELDLTGVYNINPPHPAALPAPRP